MKNFKVLYQDNSSITFNFTAKEGSANSTQEIQDGDVITQITQQVPESYHKILAMRKPKNLHRMIQTHKVRCRRVSGTELTLPDT